MNGKKFTVHMQKKDRFQRDRCKTKKSLRGVLRCKYALGYFNVFRSKVNIFRNA